MHGKALGWGIILSLGAAVALPAATVSERLHDDYVTGLNIISLAQASKQRAADVLGTVEVEADSQSDKLTEMERGLTAIQSSLADLEAASDREINEGKRLIDERALIETRLTAVGTALSDLPKLLAGATRSVNDLLATADKTGRLPERRYAEQFAGELKTSAERLQRAVIEQGQLQISIQLEMTLLQGLQERASKQRDETAAGKRDANQLAQQIAAQRAITSNLFKDLHIAADQLHQQAATIDALIGQFRLVQVSVLRRWLLDGPPNGDLPALTISDVLSEHSREKLRRPDPSAAVLGSNPMANAGGIADAAMVRANGQSEAENLTDVTMEFVTLTKRVRWYLSMLDRLGAFVDESFSEAEGWKSRASDWRTSLVYEGSRLSSARGRLTTLSLEQDVVATTVKLITEQAKTAQAQGDKAAKEIEGYAVQLREIMTSLEKAAKASP